MASAALGRVKLPVQLRKYYIYANKGKDKAINARVNYSLQEILKSKQVISYLNQNLTRELRKRQDFSNRAFLEIIHQTDVDNLIVPQFFINKENMYTLSLHVYDRDLKIIFKKISHNNLSATKNILKMESWAKEYFSRPVWICPCSG